jgi:tetratricopeptide (TPR) repeat protein
MKEYKEMSRKDDLEELIRGSYEIIRENERIKPVVEPREKARAQGEIEAQWKIIRDWLTDYILLSRQQRVPIPNDIIEIAGRFPEFADVWLSSETPVVFQDRPPRAAVFIARERERKEFQRSLDGLLSFVASADKADWAQGFLIWGEGGMGKSTLLGEYVQMCETQEEHLYWLYVDWETARVDSQGGTKAMMLCMRNRLQDKYSVTFSRFDAEYERQREVFNDLSQHKLSEAFIADLVHIAQERPIVLLFDTYEMVSRFADEWVRKGLYRYCFGDSGVGRKFLIVIAGRLPLEVEPRHRDDVRRYACPLAYFHKPLDRFTEDDIRDFLNHRLPDHQITPHLISRAHTITMGIPLAVDEIATIVRDGGDIDQLFGDIKESVGEQKVIALVTQRYLKHLRALPEKERERDLHCIYTFAAIREEESAKDAQTIGQSDIVRREKFLRDIWFKSRLVNSTEEFYRINWELRQRYSFLLPGYRMHSEVRSFLRKALYQGTVESGQLVHNINRAAKGVCESRLRKRERELEVEYSEKEAKYAKYKDREWQGWLLDLINHLLWLWEYDEAVKRIANEYVMARQHGSGGFHRRLLAIVQGDELLYHGLSMHHREYIQKLPSLGVEDLLEEEERRTRLLVTARVSIDDNAFEAAERQLVQAEEAYEKIGEKEAEFEIKLAAVYHLLGRRLAESSRNRQIQQHSLDILKRAQRWLPSDPHIHSAQGNVLTNLLWLEQAKLAYESAQALSKDTLVEVQRGMERIARFEEAGLGNQRKQARILTSEASALSSLAEFDDAEKLFKRAIAADPAYILPRVKLAHLFRQLGNFGAAQRLLDETRALEVAERYQYAILYDAYGALYLAMEQFDQAIEAYQEAIHLSPEYINPHNGLGKVHIRLDKPREALQTFEQALRLMRISKVPLRASLFWVYNGLGIANLLLDQRNGALESFQIAELRCRKQLKRESRQYLTWAHLGLALLGQQQYGDSLEALERFSQICHAKGITKEIFEDVCLIVSCDKSEGWQQIRAFVASIL